jgi:2-polyprenyl-6-methoxyphenol hydroxylase-like FAD-dependent oxidoreductase
MEVGAAVARALTESPWRVALIASSSWSHAFLTRKNYHLYPDVPADRRLYEALKAGDYGTWRATTLADIEESGQQELLNWFTLIGAMEALGRKPAECDFVESWALNSNKCFAVFKP